MAEKEMTYQEIVERTILLENENAELKRRANLIPADIKESTHQNKITVEGIDITWDVGSGVCYFSGLPVAWMWVDSTLAGLMSGVEQMVGPERFLLALQAEGRKSVESDWNLISKYPEFPEGFKALNIIARVAGWGDWQLQDYSYDEKKCVFRSFGNWEGLYQKSLGVCWGSGMLAGKFAGICSKLFNVNCWATQTKFVANGDEYDEFVVEPSLKSIEKEIEKLLFTEGATYADLSIAYEKLKRSESELIKKSDELGRLNSYFVDRELKMVELKKEINVLLVQTGEKEKYKVFQ